LGGPYQVLASLIKDGDLFLIKTPSDVREVSGFLGGRGGDWNGTNEMKTERIQVRRRKLKNNMYFPKSCTMGGESIVKRS
jgi:hypothetical protein